MDPSLRTMIEQAEFKESFRGYDRAQVDDTLEGLATRAAKLESELAEASRRLGDAETRIRAEAEAEIESRVQAKIAEGGVATPVRNEEQDVEEVRLTLVMAQRTADAAIAEARSKAAELLDAARTEALRATADARSEATKERQEGRKRLAVEVEQLESVRSVLQIDITAMESYLEGQRKQLSEAIDRLRAVIDDPASLRPAKPPAATPVVIPEPPKEETAAKEAAVAQPAAGAAAAGPKQAPAPSGGAAAGNAAAGNAARGNAAAGNSAGGATKAAAQTAPTAAGPKGGQPGGPANVAPAGKAGADTKQPAAGGPAAGVAPEEDAFLSELRKAMTDEEPATPAAPAAGRVGGQQKPQAAGANANDRDKPRFGRRH